MTETLKPRYVIYSYGNTGVFKVIKFKYTEKSLYFDKKRQENKKNDQKLLNNLCRAKSMVLQYGLCNKWDYFVTFTLDQKKYNRFNLKVFQKDLSQWLCNERKKYNTPVRYLYIPEMHKDGAWHAHGLLQGIPDECVSDFIPGKHPQKLIDGGYKNWIDYERKFGFISMGLVKNSVATAFYISKYITKSLTFNNIDLGAHLYYCSKGLKKAYQWAELYLENKELDGLLKYHGDFCSIGIVQKGNKFDNVEFENVPGLDDLTVEDIKIDENTGEVKKIYINPFKNVEYEDVKINGFFDFGMHCNDYDSSVECC